MAFAPFTQTLRVYKGMTYAYQQNFTENGSDLDLTTVDDIEVRLFNSNGEIFSHSVSGGELTISGSNNESLAGTASDTTMDIAKRSYYQETIFKRSDGTQDVYVAFRVIVIDAEDQQNQTAHEWDITIDTDAETVSGEQLTGLTALALQYKDEAQDIKESLEWKGAWDTNTTYAEDNRVSYQGESFISLQDSNQGNTPVGDAGDAFWDILAEKGESAQIGGDVRAVSNYHNLEIYDSFQRADENPLGTAESGQTYQTNGTKLVDGKAVTNNSSDTTLDSYINVTFSRFHAKLWTENTSTTTHRSGINIVQDANNFITLYSNSMIGFGIVKVIGGSAALIASIGFDNNDPTSGSFPPKEVNFIYAEKIIHFYGETGESKGFYDLSTDSDMNTLLDNTVGLGLYAKSTNVKINSWAVWI